MSHIFIGRKMKKNLVFKLKKFITLSSSKTNEILFYISYTFFMIDTMFSEIENIDIFFAILNYSSLLMLGFLFLIHFKEYKKRNLILMIITGLILFINFIITDHNTTFVRLFLLIISFKYIDFNKFIKLDLIVKTLCCCMVICLSELGFIEIAIWYRDNGIRQSLGFGHSNTLGFAMLSICFSYVYVRYIDFNKWDSIVTMLLFAFVAYFSRSRAAEIGFILLFMCLIALKLNDYIKEHNKQLPSLIDKLLFYLKKAIPFIPMLVFVVNMTLVLLYNQNISILYKINSFFSNRLYYSSVFWKDYGISLFGQNLYTLTHAEADALNVEARILDSAYLRLLLRHGLLIFMIFMSLAYFSLKYLLKETNKQKEILLVILIIFYVLGIMEGYLINVCYNPFLLYFAMFIFNKNLGDESLETTD